MPTSLRTTRQSPARRPVRRTAALVALALAAVTRSDAQAVVPPPDPSLLTGVWTLVVADRIGPDGVRRPDYGAHPHGRMMIAYNGRYSTQIYSEERLRFTGGDKVHATPDEIRLSVLGMSAHFGTIVVDSTAAILTFRIERAAFPNWEGTEQRRQYELKGDELTYRVPASASTDGSIAISVWRRAP